MDSPGEDKVLLVQDKVGNRRHQDRAAVAAAGLPGMLGTAGTRQVAWSRLLAADIVVLPLPLRSAQLAFDAGGRIERC